MIDIRELIETVSSYGFKIVIADGKPALRRTCHEATIMPLDLLDMLKARRDEIIQKVTHDDREATPEISVRWATGLESTHWFPEQGWPIGATQWRRGGGDWQPIPAAERDAAAKSAREWVRGWRTVGGGSLVDEPRGRSGR